MNGKSMALALLSGVLLVLAFPKLNQDFLVWTALIPLLFAIRNVGPCKALGIGIIAGFVFNIGLVYWIVYVVNHYGNLPFFFSVAMMLLFAFYLSLYVGLFAMGVTLTGSSGVPVIVSGPVLWTALEYIKSNALTGFPWENLGYALHDRIYFIQLADITGVYGVTFLVVLVNCMFFDLLKREGGSRRLVIKTAVCAGITAAVLSYGCYRIASVKVELIAAESLSVGLIQGNIDQSVKWHPDYQEETIRIYSDLSSKAAYPRVDLVIWPETAAPVFFQDVDDNHRKILDVAGETGAALLFGSPSYTFVNERLALLNSSWLVSPGKDIMGRYDKTHLVPFGEYVPLRRILFFVDKLVEGFSDFVPGNRIKPLVINDMAAGVLICYEGIFPEISRSYTRSGADYLVNITNDAWYGRTSAPHQHLSMLPLRAVENRRAIARAANTGISAFVDPLGRITGRTALFERDVLMGTVKVSSISTFYTQYGDIFALGCIFMSGILLFYRRRWS
ncbi:MAG: apolipoprotein N-acyltransferase [Syntrophales bacterium]|nr:apolipoprotein N-acyltransferase [Syntrophales bacterium]